MTTHFNGAAIIGVGLLGCSLGLALKARHPKMSVVGIGRRLESLEIALERGAVDKITTDVAEGVADAELIVIATPVRLVIPMLDQVLAASSPHAIILDVASTKGAICAHAAQVCPSPRRFIGCHPMAGAETFGPAYGRADLYQDQVCLIEKDSSLHTEARERVCALWRACGARVVDLDVSLHDALLARTSHAPHVVATALALAAQAGGASKDIIGNGFLDTTRIALSSPEIWRDICLENQAALLPVLAALRGILSDFERALAAADASAIEAYFQQGADARRDVTET